jgi:hypothetical protein
MAQTGFNHPWHCQFWQRDGQFSPRKISVVTIDSKLDDGVNRFFISMIFELRPQMPWLPMRVASGSEICVQNSGTYKIK